MNKQKQTSQPSLHFQEKVTSDISRLSSQVSRLSTQVDSIEEKIQALSDNTEIKITQLDKKIESMLMEILKTLHNDLQGKTQKLGDHEGRLSKIEEKLEVKYVQKREFKQLQSKVKQLAIRDKKSS